MTEPKEVTKVSTLGEICRVLNKSYGDRSCIQGTDAIDDPRRLPTGIFPFDYATGGGFPVYQASIIKGAEGGGKTSLIMSAMAKVPMLCWRCFKPLTKCECSLPPLKMKAAWCDVEGTFNEFWAESIGCNPDDYYLAASESGNEYGDVANKILSMDDCALLVVDSVAALFPSELMEASMSDKNVGLQAKLVTNFVTKINSRLTTEYKRGHPCLVIVTNQLRANIGGFSFRGGTPTPTTPGGHALRHFSGITINISKKSLQDKEKEKYYDKEHNLFLAQRHSFYIEKYKSLKLSEGGEFIRITSDIPERSLFRGDVTDHKMVVSELLAQGIMVKGTSKYTMGSKSGAQKDFVDTWKKDKNLYFEVQTDLLAHVVEKILKRDTKKKEKEKEKCLPKPVVSAAKK